MEIGVYIHIPFCIKKCDYCDFISYPSKLHKQKEYVEKIIEEIEDNREILENNEVTTIYIGGGTPSTISPDLVKSILDKIYYIANIENNIEVTIEVNPGTIIKDNFRKYIDCGINRLSIGLQSTNDQILKAIGRVHNYQQFLNTYNWANEIGFGNINIDLMLGLPHQTISDLKKSLEEVTKLKPAPKHISIYSLIIEEGTEIERKVNKGELKLPEEEEERNQYKYTKNYLELKGYKQYEISNFSKAGYKSKHNINCWEQKSYIGFGISAHSYVNGIRYSNTCDFEKYINNKSIKIKTIHEKQDIEDMKNEYMILGLRKIEGVSINKFKQKFGENPIYKYRKELQKLVKQELIIIDLDNIKLTNKGLDFANLVWEEFI